MCNEKNSVGRFLDCVRSSNVQVTDMIGKLRTSKSLCGPERFNLVRSRKRCAREVAVNKTADTPMRPKNKRSCPNAYLTPVRRSARVANTPLRLRGGRAAKSCYTCSNKSCKCCRESCKSCKAVSSISRKLQQKLQAASPQLCGKSAQI